MDKWEYEARILYADINNEGVKDDVRKRYPDWKPSRYSPEAMEKTLNERGEQGWELVHIEPVAGVGSNGDIWWQGGAVPTYSNKYFCVFKRLKRE